MTPQEKFAKARQRVLLDHRFFASIMMRMQWVEDPTCKSAWTDGKRVGYNPAFIDGLTLGQSIGVIIHEVMHNTMKHHLRRGNRDFKTWCKACDYAINYLIISYGFELPEDILLDDRFEGMSAEEIYSILMQEERKKQQEQDEQRKKEEQENHQEDSEESGDKGESDSEGEGGTGDKEDKADGKNEDEKGQTENEEGEESKEGRESQEAGEGDDEDSRGSNGRSSSESSSEAMDEVRDACDEGGEPLSESERVLEEQMVEVAVKQAETFAKRAGQGFNGMERLVGESTKTDTPWEQILERFIYEQANTMYDWSRPSRRHPDYFMPALHNYEAGNIVLVIDSSESIDKKVFGRFTDEMKMLLENITAKIWAIIADDHVQEAREITADDLCDLVPKGYGGTDFRPAFEWLDEQGITPTVLIYLTDLECYSYPDDPGYPVLWAGYGWWAKQAVVPFGEKVLLY